MHAKKCNVMIQLSETELLPEIAVNRKAVILLNSQLELQRLNLQFYGCEYVQSLALDMDTQKTVSQEALSCVTPFSSIRYRYTSTPYPSLPPTTPTP